MNSHGFLCEIYVQKSSFGDVFYLNYYFHLGKFEKPYSIDRGGAETHTPYVGSRFYFTEEDKYSCQFLDYTEFQLIEILDKNYRQRIQPPFEIGKRYLRDNYGTLYTTFLDFEKIKFLLED